jgi:hypothetical protein
MSSTPLVIAPVPLASAEGTVLSGDGWWPDIDCNDMREALRIGEAVTHARLIMALESAMITVTDDLAPGGPPRRLPGSPRWPPSDRPR